MVPDAEFTSYYGRPILKAAPWTADIPGYIFLGGLAGGSALLGAGGDLTGRPALRRSARLGAFGAISLGLAALVHDLGRPSRFINMLRTAKPTSPMSMGTWGLTAFSVPTAIAAAAELRGVPPRSVRPLAAAAGRPAGLASAALAPAIATYTAVLLSDTATPSWHEGYRHMPFVFAGSSAAAAGGFGMLSAPTAQAGPARRLAIAGTLLEVGAQRAMESSMGLAAEPMHQGRAGQLLKLSSALSIAGSVGALFARRSRALSAGSGLALLASAVCTRFGIFAAGQESARDPKYTVAAQRRNG